MGVYDATNAHKAGSPEAAQASGPPHAPPPASTGAPTHYRPPKSGQPPADHEPQPKVGDFPEDDEEKLVAALRSHEMQEWLRALCRTRVLTDELTEMLQIWDKRMKVLSAPPSFFRVDYQSYDP